MNAAEYAAKRAEHLCIWGACPKPSLPDHILCKKHLRRRKANVNRRNKARYIAKKVAGICVHPHCKDPSREDAVICQRHTEAHRRDGKRYRASDTGRAVMRRIQREYRKSRIRRGVCILCDKPLATKTLCQKHREAATARWLAKHGNGPVLDQCSNCLDVGHRSRSCTKEKVTNRLLDAPPPPMLPLRVEEFALARREAA